MSLYAEVSRVVSAFSFLIHISFIHLVLQGTSGQLLKQFSCWHMLLIVYTVHPAGWVQLISALHQKATLQKPAISEPHEVTEETNTLKMFSRTLML